MNGNRTVSICGEHFGYIALSHYEEDHIPLSLTLYFFLLAVPLLAAGVAMVYTLKSRIQEKRKGEEDDPGNY